MFGGMEAGGKYGFTNFIKDTLKVQKQSSRDVL